MSTMYNLFAHSSLVQSCLSYLIFKSTVYYHAHYLIFCSLYLFFYFISFYVYFFVLFSIILHYGADLTHISLLVNTLCIIVYVTNKS